MTLRSHSSLVFSRVKGQKSRYARALNLLRLREASIGLKRFRPNADRLFLTPRPTNYIFQISLQALLEVQKVLLEIQLMNNPSNSLKLHRRLFDNPYAKSSEYEARRNMDLSRVVQIRFGFPAI